MKNVIHFSIFLAMMSIAISGCKKEVAVTGVTVSPTTVLLAPGGTQQLTATVQPGNATNKKVTWSSGNTARATVGDNGLVTIPANATAGVATITVITDDGGKTADCTITVSVYVTEISIAPSGEVTVEVGKTTTFTPTVTPSNASNKTITWSSLNTGIATVNAQTGVITGVSAGTATIRATAADGSGVTADKSITVATSMVKATGITIAPSGNVSVIVGETATLTATVAPDNATNKNVTWSSLNTGIATVNAQTGLVTGVSAGTATIRATAADDSGVTADKSVTVTTSVVRTTGITIAPSGDVSVVMGETATLTATVAPDNATNKSVTWSSLNTGIATVNAQTGLVTGVSAGTATIRATAADGSGVTANKSVMVITAIVRTTGVTISPTGDMTVEMGRTVILTANVTPDNATNKNVTWGSDNSGIAAVNEAGVVTGISAGTTTIRATTADGSNLIATKSVTIIASLPMTGRGTLADPYIIRTPAHLDAVRDNLSAHYKLGNNIDLSGYLVYGGIGYAKWGTAGWEPIRSFKGSFDGAGYKITGLWIFRTIGIGVRCGLFDELYGSVQNLGVELGTYSDTQFGIYCSGYSGGISTWVHKDGSINNCYVVGKIYGYGSDAIGGIAGDVDYGGSITNCYAIGEVTGSSHIGGVVGRNDGNVSGCYSNSVVNGVSNVGGVAGYILGGSITNCYAIGTVSGYNNIGGVVGNVAGSYNYNGYTGSNMTNCYATGAVSGTGINVGGVVGNIDHNSNITNCYATGNVSGGDYVGGVVGYVAESSGSITNNVSLSSSVTSSKNTVYIGRVAGFVFQFDLLSNNWARSNMTVTANGVSKTLIKAGNMLDGADCDATPAANWWTSAAPNGPGWSSSIWTFSTGQLPQLR